MTDDERHGTRKDDDHLGSGPYRDGFWQAIAENKNNLELLRSNMTTVENAVMRFERLTDGLDNDMKRIREICETLNETLIRFDARITATEKQVISLWAFPLKFAGVIVVLGGATAAAYKLVCWLLSVSDVRIIR